MSIAIYGAQGIALGTYNAIKVLHPEMEVECFLVTSIANNATVLGGIPVKELKEFALEKTVDEKNNIEVWIATPENVMGEIEKSLDEVGLCSHVRIDSIKWADMQDKFFSSNGEFTPLTAYTPRGKKQVIEVYKMIHRKDKELSADYKIPSYLIPLQVGTALGDVQIVELADNVGDNISDRNGDYSELTGLYWMWKNRILQDDFDEEKHYGLAHYRRFLDLSEEDLMRLSGNDIEVVLPYPMPYEPNIEAHHNRYLSSEEWSAVLQALRELQPEYANAFGDILKQEYLFNYNIVVAKKNVLNDYCSWLFPLLFRIEEINNPNGEKEPNRYMGYIAETLETLYFMYNSDKLRITHTGCRFLS